MDVIVTGGAGFIGSHTVDLLLSEGYDVIVVDDFYSGSLDNLPRSDGRLRVLRVDVSDWSVLRGEISRAVSSGGVVGIVHLAALINIVEVMSNPQRALDVNVKGTVNVLELARLLDADRVVFASSTAVHGEPLYLPVDEDHPLNPANLYGETKVFSERLLDRYRDDYGLKTIALRYFNVYGPRMRPGPYAGVVLAFIEALLKDRRPIIYGSGFQTRDFVYVKDVAEANLLALKTCYTGVLEIGSGVETSIKDLYYMICGVIGSCLEPEFKPPRPGDVQRSRADIELAWKSIHWKPETGLLDGLRDTVSFYRSRFSP
ncbi:MAG: SDR family NAD(P)-dependent oxidoreductase [Desulfurococcales archaeon]|nr:SDR family NAD(P)-dependent oxidoreductase [Desulfurococcales archaeon]